MYSEGRGVAQNIDQAVYWYCKNVEQDFAEGEAVYQLGRMYSEGHDVAQNDEQATYCFRMAAEQGNLDAQEALSKLGIDWKK